MVAVSGGADSIALLRAIHANATNEKLLTVAHFNHGLRGAESDGDEQFAIDSCRQLGIDVQTARAATDSLDQTKTGIGLESAARNARYDFLRATAEKIGARYVLTAHTADDQAETVLHNICRGTGLAGVAGIPFARPINEALTVVRPLLRITRDEVVGYLKELGQPYRTDTSNQSDQYTRNRIRNQVIPLLETQVNSATRGHLCQLAQIAREAMESLDLTAANLDLESAITLQTALEIHLDREILRKSPDLIAVHFLKRCWAQQDWPLRDMDVNRWEKVMTIVNSGSDQPDCRPITLPGSIAVEPTGSTVRFRMLTGMSD